MANVPSAANDGTIGFQGGAMTQWTSAVAMIAAILLSENAIAESLAQKKMASVDYLVGTWSCTHTVGSFSGTYRTTYAKSLGNLWLRQTYDFPPRQFGSNESPVNAEFLIGYDERREAWVRFGVTSTGQYFAIRMTDTDDGGWSYKYVSFFKRQTPETPESDATFVKKSNAEYVVDGPSYEQGGTRVTEHNVCRKG
jgi:hypothetical protein